MKIKIAVVQFRVKQHDPERNLKRIEQFIKKAAKKKTQIIVFPEDFITGLIEHKPQLADAKGEYKQRMAALAKKYKIDIVAGSLIEKVKGKLYNTTYYIDASGTILGRHRKNHLWGEEKGHFTPGNDVGIIKTAYGKVGILICWDMLVPELWNNMLKQGVQLVFCPSYWSFCDARKGVNYNPQSEVVFVDAMAITKAFTNETVVIFCNVARNHETKKDAPIGRSQITVPFMGPLKRLKHHREKMFVQEIDTSILNVAEKAYQIRKDR